MNLDKILIGMHEESCRLHAEGRDSEALFTCEQLAVQSLNTLGLAYCGYLPNYDKAINCFFDALKIEPSNWLLWSNICHVRSLQERHKEALSAAIQSIKFSDGIAFDPYYNAGVTLTALGRCKEAVEMYRAALQISPEHSQINYNLGLCLLRIGEWKDGWEKYEYRFKTSELTGRFKDRFIQDQWDGRKFKKKSLAVYSEQGLGDFIFFARFLPMVKALGGKVICEVQEPLKDVIGKNLKIDELVSRPNNTEWPAPPDSDYAVSISSLPRILKIDSLDKVPNRPYIAAPNKPRPRGFSNKKFNIGLCWAGNSDHQRDYTRSMFLNHFKPLADNPKVQLFGLVKGVRNQRKWPEGVVDLNYGIDDFPMVNLENQINGFGDLAHYINHLDLVLTVDTGLAHLAGAMGKPVWVLLGKETDWRWGDDATTSAWYPSMRLFRRQDTWENLVSEVITQLPS